MSVSVAANSAVAGTGQTIDVAALFSVSTVDPAAYLIVTALDQDFYPLGDGPSGFGRLTGNGVVQSFQTASAFETDSWAVSVIYTYESGAYVNSTYGAFDDLAYVTGSFADDNVNISVFTTNTSLSPGAVNDAQALLSISDPGSTFQELSYAGSVAIVTLPGTAPPAQAATPNAIVSAASSFVGQVWNSEGCWSLASDISAKAGASLPISSAFYSIQGLPSGEWIIAYDGPTASVAQQATWESTLLPGEMVTFQTQALGGHIATVVSGAGSKAKVIDNAEFVSHGTVTNSASDGSPDDIIIQAAHAVSAEFSGVTASSVVVYELDTPIVGAAGSATVTAAGTLSLASLFADATDPAGRSITAYQAFDTAGRVRFAVGGAAPVGAVGSTNAISADTPGSIALVAGATAGTDTIELRAFNGLYWGDWQSGTVTIASGCFLTGTRIATPGGELAVEALRRGADVRLADGGSARVRWVGRQTLACRFVDPVRHWPVRIRAGALGAGLPHRDLWLSPGHALFRDGVLAVAGALVDGVGIRHERPATETFTYWHVELDRHALLLAEGAACESYLDGHEDLPFDNRTERPPPPETAELPYPRCKSPRQLPRRLRRAIAA